MLQPSIFHFLRQLKENNNREWFAENKDRYIAANSNVADFVEHLIDEIDSSVQVVLQELREYLAAA